MPNQFVKNKVIGAAVRQDFPNATALLQLGVHDTNRDLTGVGVGDTIQMTTFDLLPEGLNEFKKGDEIEYDELSSTSKDVKVKAFARGVKIHDHDVKFSVGGGSIQAEATRQLTQIFARGLDTAAQEEILKSNIAAVDGTGGLTANLILDQILKHFGENAMEKAAAIVIPSVVAGQLMNGDQNLYRSNFVQASENGYQATYRFEIGKLYNQIPVIMSDRVKHEEVDGDKIYKSLVLPKNAFTYVLGQDVRVESDRDISTKYNYFNADNIFAMAKGKDAVIINTAAK